MRTRTEAAVRLAVCSLLSALIVQACGDDPSSKREQVNDTPDGATSAGGRASGVGGTPGMGGTSSSTGGVSGTGGSLGTGGSVITDAGRPSACDAGSAACLGDRVARLCSPEGDWVNVPCGANERCDQGLCTVVQPCTPGEKVCATDRAAKVCDTDGSAWIVEVCAEGKICTGGECVRDLVDAECVPGQGQCLNGTTRLRCLPAGRGFESFDCPATAPCSNGECVGPACTVGDTQCAFSGNGASAVRTCAEGTGFTEAPCPAGGSCRESFPLGRRLASCTAGAPCQFQGQRVCGDATDPASDPRTSFSECEFQQDGSLAWTRVDCTSPATCSPSNIGCTRTCSPGEKRCAGTGYETCGPDGTWLPAQPCGTGSSTAGLACRRKTGGALPDVECVDAVCAFLSNPASVDGGVPSAGGVCDGTRIRRCDPAGVLLPAEDCGAGVCKPLGTSSIAGFRPGECSVDCQSGESRCVSDGLPLYVTCEAGGTWSTAHQSCGSTCRTAVDANGMRKHLCGDQCLAGDTRCEGDRVQTCGSGSTWLASVACTVGKCAESDGGAVCLAECVPGALTCVGDAKDASDGISHGTAESAVCTAAGLLPTTTTVCAGTETCRTSRTGVTAGCVECLGPGVPGGNDSGLVDSRCSASGSGVEVCGTGGAWGAASGCGTGSSCFIGRGRTCGACPNVFISGECTVTNLRQQIFPDAVCESFGLGAATGCGDTPDCCGNACVTSEGAFAFCAPTNFSPCLGSTDVTPLGSTVPQTVPGTTLFGDDSLAPTCSFRQGTTDAAFTFTAPRSSTFVFDTFGSTIDTIVYVVDSLSCNELACNDDAQAGASRVLVDLVGGQRVIVMVEGLGDFTLNVVDANVPGCGNGFRDGGELCDGNDLGGQNCFSATLGSLPFGTLLCDACQSFDVSGCRSSGPGGGTGGFTGTGGGAGSGASGGGAAPGFDSGPG